MFAEETATLSRPATLLEMYALTPHAFPVLPAYFALNIPDNARAPGEPLAPGHTVEVRVAAGVLCSDQRKRQCPHQGIPSRPANLRFLVSVVFPVHVCLCACMH